MSAYPIKVIPMNSHNYDKSREMYERAMESVNSKVEYAKDKIEKLSVELSDIELHEDEREELDDLISKALVSLDRIVD